jgi:NAD-dependent dihydropyrimidine dehydrogenase PreA subunit
MPIALNFKICDNSPDCLGILKCPTKAFYFDKKRKSLVIDNNKCVSCGLCVKECEVNAIKLAKNNIQLKQIQDQINADPRTQSDLFIDRYGSEPQDKKFFCPEEKFDIQIIQSTKPAVVECFDEESIHCLVYSIPIKELFKNKNIVYRKFAVKNKKFKLKYKFKQLPALLFFNNGKLVGKIIGYYSINDKEKLLSQINKLF